MTAIATYNQAVVLDIIRRAPDGIGRARLAELTGLVPQSISNTTRKLLDEGLIEECRTAPVGRGKPPMVLRLRPEARYAVGVHIDADVVGYALVDLGCNVVASHVSATPPANDATSALAELTENVTRLLESSGVRRSAVLGVGVGAPGPLDTSHGVIGGPRHLDQWRDVPIRDAIVRATGLPVLLEKDVTAAIVGELWTAMGRRDRSLTYVYLGAGVGIGAALCGEPVRGVHGNAGEGGTLVIDTDRPAAIGGTRMLGHLVDPAQLLEDAAASGGIPTTEPGRTPTIGDLVAAARGGHPGACAVFARAGSHIADAVVSVVNLLDVDEVVFGGPAWPHVGELLLPEFQHRLDTSPLRSTPRPLTVTLPRSTDDVAALGAACLVLDASLSPRSSGMLIARN
ncbi:MAG TPA: ROK family transcriptional regulator [Candidatus Lumbricidophila sp.]|nr:ROK family transcriptional regulator [Candidatus Lumbricidophila sp.]